MKIFVLLILIFWNSICCFATHQIPFFSNCIPPTLSNDLYAVSKNNSATGNLSDNDMALDNPVYELVSLPSIGNVFLQSTGAFSYTPPTNYCGNISFIYQVCNDGENTCCSQATVSIEIVDLFCKEICNDGADNDNDGLIDELDADCACITYANIIENNCCQSCSEGNLEVKATHWNPDNINLISTNIAAFKPTMFNASPNFYSSNATLSVDTEFEGEASTFYDYAFSPAGENNYWNIDLVGFYDIESIHVFTKTGCCNGNAINYRIFIANTPFGTASFEELQNQVNIQQFAIPVVVNGSPSILNNINTNGRFVRIYLEGTGQMQLIEVEILGSGNQNSQPYQYSWSDPAIGNKSNANCLPPGNYEVTITDIATGCFITKETTLN